MQIPRKPLEDFDDTVVLYDLWHVQSLSNSFLYSCFENIVTALYLTASEHEALFFSSLRKRVMWEGRVHLL